MEYRRPTKEEGTIRNWMDDVARARRTRGSRRLVAVEPRLARVRSRFESGNFLHGNAARTSSSAGNAEAVGPQGRAKLPCRGSQSKPAGNYRGGHRCRTGWIDPQHEGDQWSRRPGTGGNGCTALVEI